MAWHCQSCKEEIPVERVWFFHRTTQQWRPVDDESMNEEKPRTYCHDDWDAGVRFPCGEVIWKEAD